MNNDTLYTALVAKGNAEDVPHLMQFFQTGKGQYGEGDQFLGIRVPIIRQLVKQYQAACTWADIEEWIKSPYHEVRLATLLVLCAWYECRKEDCSRIVEFYIAHTRYVNNWDLVDLTCHEILGKWLLHQDRKLLYEWAKNGHLWEQRIAIVSTVAFIRNGEYEDTLQLCEILIHHQHDLIHKATGWMLREVGKREEQVLTAWLDRYYHDMPRTMLRYSIERLTPAQRAHYMAR